MQEMIQEYVTVRKTQSTETDLPSLKEAGNDVLQLAISDSLKKTSAMC